MSIYAEKRVKFVRYKLKIQSFSTKKYFTSARLCILCALIFAIIAIASLLCRNAYIKHCFVRNIAFLQNKQ